MSEDVGAQEFVFPEDIGVRKIVLELVVIIENFGFPVFDSAVSFLSMATKSVTVETVIAELVNIEGKYSRTMFMDAIRYIYQYAKEVQSYVQQHAEEIQSYVQQHSDFIISEDVGSPEVVGAQEFVFPEDIGVRNIVLELVEIIKNFGFPVFAWVVSSLVVGTGTKSVTVETVIAELVNIEGKYTTLFIDAIRYIYQYEKEVQSYVQQHAEEIQSYVQQRAEEVQSCAQRSEENVRRCVQKLISTPEVLPVGLEFYEALERIFKKIDELSDIEFNNLFANLELVSHEITSYMFKNFIKILDEIKRKYGEKNCQLGRKSCHQNIHEQYEIRLRNLVRQLSDKPPVFSKMFCDMLNVCVENLENLYLQELRNIIKGMHSVADRYGDDLLDYWRNPYDKFNRRLAELENKLQEQKFTVERLPQEAPHEPPAVAGEPSAVRV